MGIMKNQTAARLVLQTNVDFSVYTPTSAAVKYQKPDGIRGYWTATKLETDLESGKIYVDFSSDVKFDLAGMWILSAYIVFSDTRNATGENVKYKVSESIS